MSEETATPAGTSASTGTRKSGLSSRRRSTPKPGTPTSPALAPEREDAYQAFPRIWPD